MPSPQYVFLHFVLHLPSSLSCPAAMPEDTRACGSTGRKACTRRFVYAQSSLGCLLLRDCVSCTTATEPACLCPSSCMNCVIAKLPDKAVERSAGGRIGVLISYSP